MLKTTKSTLLSKLLVRCIKRINLNPKTWKSRDCNSYLMVHHGWYLQFTSDLCWQNGGHQEWKQASCNTSGQTNLSYKTKPSCGVHFYWQMQTQSRFLPWGCKWYSFRSTTDYIKQKKVQETEVLLSYNFQKTLIWPSSDNKRWPKLKSETINAVLVGKSHDNTNDSIAWKRTVLSLTGSAGPQNSRKVLGASVACISRAMQGPEQSSSTIFCNTSIQELTISLGLPVVPVLMKELIIWTDLGKTLEQLEDSSYLCLLINISIKGCQSKQLLLLFLEQVISSKMSSHSLVIWFDAVDFELWGECRPLKCLFSFFIFTLRISVKPINNVQATFCALHINAFENQPFMRSANIKTTIVKAINPSNVIIVNPL